MRRLVIQELEQDTGRKRGVRKVWEALKSKGQHIKRCAVSFLPLLTASLAYLSDFVGNVMKDVDPNGFKQRRPRWKPETIAGLSDAADQALLPLKVPPAASISSQHSSRAVVHPITVDQSTDMHLEMEAHPVPQSLDYSVGHPALDAHPLGFEIFPGTFTGGDLILPTGGHGIGRWGLDVGLGEDCRMDSDSAPLLNPEPPGSMGSVAVDRHTRDDTVNRLSLMAFHQDAPHFDDLEDDQVQPSSGITGSTPMPSGGSTSVLVSMRTSPATDTVSMEASDST